MHRGFVYLCAVLEWASRRVLAGQLSHTLTTGFCLDAVREAITQYRPPDIFNTDQGCQSTSLEFTGMLNAHGMQIIMDTTPAAGEVMYLGNASGGASRMRRSISTRTKQFVTHSRGSIGTATSIIKSGRIARLTDAPDRVYGENRPV